MSSRDIFIIFGDRFFSHVVIACNTAHILSDEIEECLGTSPTSLIEATVAEVQRCHHKIVGVLASPTTEKNGLFQRALEPLGVRLITPDAITARKVETMIRETIGGRHSPSRSLQAIIEAMQADGAERVILGCTELSVIGDSIDKSNVIDPLRLVVDEIFKEK